MWGGVAWGQVTWAGLIPQGGTGGIVVGGDGLASGRVEGGDYQGGSGIVVGGDNARDQVIGGDTGGG